MYLEELKKVTTNTFDSLSNLERTYEERVILTNRLERHIDLLQAYLDEVKETL